MFLFQMSDIFDDQYQYDSSDDTRSDSDFEVVIDHPNKESDLSEEEESDYEECTYVANWKSGLMKHKQGKHEGPRYFCEQCNFTSCTKHGLGTHNKKVIHEEWH